MYMYWRIYKKWIIRPWPKPPYSHSWKPKFKTDSTMPFGLRLSVNSSMKTLKGERYIFKKCSVSKDRRVFIIQGRTSKLKDRGQRLHLVPDLDLKRISIMVILDQIQFTSQFKRKTINHSAKVSFKLPWKTFLRKLGGWIPLKAIRRIRGLPIDSILKQGSSKLRGLLSFCEAIKVGCNHYKRYLVHQ